MHKKLGSVDIINQLHAHHLKIQNPNSTLVSCAIRYFEDVIVFTLYLLNKLNLKKCIILFRMFKRELFDYVISLKIRKNPFYDVQDFLTQIV